MLITKACLENKKEILDLYQSVAGKDFCVWDMEYPNYETIGFDVNSDGLYICKIDDRIVSAISVVRELELNDVDNWVIKDNVVELSRFVVCKEYQGKGISKKMLEYVFSDLKLEGIKAVHLACQYKNIPAKKLYESFDFVIVCEKDLYEDHYLLMEKVL